MLLGFDVDSCSIAYDGQRIWCTPRAHRALVAGYNRVDLTRRSPTYETRLIKYARRGYAILGTCVSDLWVRVRALTLILHSAWVTT